MRSWVLLAAVAVGGLCIAAPNEAQLRKEAATFLAGAEKFEKAKNPHAAVGNFAMAAGRLSRIPDRAGAEGLLARAAALPVKAPEQAATVVRARMDVAYNLGDWDDVRKYADELKKVEGRKNPEPDRIAAENYLGYTARKEGRPDEAIRHFLAALDENTSTNKNAREFADYYRTSLMTNRLDICFAIVSNVEWRVDLPAKERSWAACCEADLWLHRTKPRDFKRAIAAAERALAYGGNAYDACSHKFEALCQLGGKDCTAAYEFIEDVCGDWEKFGFTKENRERIWSQYGYMAFRLFDLKRIKKAYGEIEDFGGKPALYMPMRCTPALKMYADYEDFPKDEDDIVFPKKNIWVRETKTVRAKDFGWNATNATACLQAAFDSGATTVVVDDMGSPWFIRNVKVRSNQTVRFAKGVKVLADAFTAEENKQDLDMFSFLSVSNVVFVGEGEKPSDVSIGKYPDYATRKKLCRRYGGSGMGFDAVRNVVVRNLRIAECSMDSVHFTGLGVINTDVWFEDVVLDSSYRQACSICNGDGLYFRNVVFSNTRGASPAAGIDLEPSIEIEANSNIYLYDCVFKNNYGGGLVFASSSYYPVTLHAKRCRFEPHDNGAVRIFARCGIYMGADRPAPSKVILEDCDIRGYSDKPPVVWDNSSLFNVEFRGGKVTEVGPSRKNATAKAAPFFFNLNREYWYYFNWKDYAHQGEIVIDDVDVTGYTNTPEIVFGDRTGHYSVTEISGKFRHNGEKVKASQFSYKAPDLERTDIGSFDAARFARPADPFPADGAMHFGFYWDAPWYSAKPQRHGICWGEKGRKASFTMNFPNWTSSVGQKLLLVGPTTTNELATVAKGDNDVAFAFPETGWHTMEFPGQGRITKADGVGFAFSCHSLESLYKITPDGKFKDERTFYFEVPTGGREGVFKVDGGAELYNAKGELVDRTAFGEVNGYRYFTCKPSSKAAEVWSVRLLGTATSTIKFFAPLNGVIAQRPDWLPREK